jgi:hypothetical protein
MFGEIGVMAYCHRPADACDDCRSGLARFSERPNTPAEIILHPDHRIVEWLVDHMAAGQGRLDFKPFRDWQIRVVFATEAAMLHFYMAFELDPTVTMDVLAPY